MNTKPFKNVSAKIDRTLYLKIFEVAFARNMHIQDAIVEALTKYAEENF